MVSLVFNKGNVPWNKGLTKETNKKVKGVSLVNTGRKHSEKTIKILRKKAKKRFKDKTNHPMYGRKHLEKSKKEMSEKAKGRINEKNSNWKGGCMMYWYQQARKIVEKLTGIKPSKEIVVHHIDGDITNCNPSNLLVCTNSYHQGLHRKLERVYGKNWREVFQNRNDV